MGGTDKHVFPLALAAAIAATIFSKDAVLRPVQAQSGPISPKIVCSYDPSTGVPNPLGMRSFITLIETDGTTEVVYEQLGTFVPGPVETVLTSERSLLFPNQAIDRVRQLLITHDTYYRELVGFEDSDGFVSVNSTLICRAESVASPAAASPAAASGPSTAATPPEPRSSSSSELPDLAGDRSRGAELPDLGNPGGGARGEARGEIGLDADAETPSTFYDTIAGLADGNYRYVSGPADDRVYTAQELVRRGGALFVFRKTEDEIIGAYSYINGESICVTGRVSGNTLSGQAYPDNGVARDLTEEFVAWGPAPFLRVRRTRGDDGGRYYASAALELNDFSRINAGSSLPPSGCD